VCSGTFQEDMDVEVVMDGAFSLLVDSRMTF
jgi:hypothetical protein